ncbi:DUF6929 family protein [Hymenobacter psychrotolerans]|uniref:Uncharacterized protein n=1 Tax=Hymenobacter psychrotolerans DSM 18569 TaxID=1121959 RepID=A0A1M7GKP6_9BACT|nr:hypothetical protein [Hymenobacter psychrotolerans]SHM16698.1 hypothetical protein SAMN02746009_04056 [Hymenobacter psychrotolerans DSM 18569]
MRATIIRQLDLPNLPSASGVEILGETVYIIGDDSPYLYRFGANELQPGQAITLFDTAHFSSGRIPKAIKPDLECLTALTDARTGETGLLAFGSGATSAREGGFWVPIGSKPAAVTVYPVALAPLYARLRELLPAGVTLNLEAAAASATELLLFQRTVGAQAGNFIYRLPLAATLDYLQHRQAQLPPVRAQHFSLPEIEGKPAGFSGASFHGGRLFVTASVEDTTDAVLDGAVLGSFVGVLNPDKPAAALASFALLQLPDGRPYRGKVESVAVRRTLAQGRYELLLVTDDDQGGSTAVLVEMQL